MCIGLDATVVFEGRGCLLPCWICLCFAYGTDYCAQIITEENTVKHAAHRQITREADPADVPFPRRREASSGSAGGEHLQVSALSLFWSLGTPKRVAGSASLTDLAGVITCFAGAINCWARNTSSTYRARPWHHRSLVPDLSDLFQCQTTPLAGGRNAGTLRPFTLSGSGPGTISDTPHLFCRSSGCGLAVDPLLIQQGQRLASMARYFSSDQNDELAAGP